MPASRYHTVDFEPPGLRVAVTQGTSLLEAALQAGIQLLAGCGRQGTCGQCQLVIIEGETSELTEEELECLTVAEIDNQNRLACYTYIQSSVKVYIPKRSFSNGRSTSRI